MRNTDRVLKDAIVLLSQLRTNIDNKMDATPTEINEESRPLPSAEKAQLNENRTKLGYPLPCVHPLVVLVFIVLFIYFYFQHKNGNTSKKQPPGPRGLPFLGCVLQLIRNPFGKLREYADQYGPIYKMKLGPQTVVMLNTVEVIKEAFLAKGSVFNNRPTVFSKLLGLENRGIVLLQLGRFHKEQRMMFSKVVRSLGPDAFDIYVKTHIVELKQILTDSNRSPIDICPHIGNVIFASIGQIIFGVDTDVNHIRHLVEGNLSNNPILVLSGKVIPENIKSKISKYMDMSTNFQKSIKKMLHLVHERHKNLDFSHGFGDLIGGFLHTYKEMKAAHESSSKPGSPFVDEEQSTSDEQLAAILMDCYQAGMEATTAQMKWVFLYLARHPHVQVKIQQEMDRVVGQGETPSIKHRQHHPYTLAAINEVLRIRPTASMGAPHSPNTDASISGYDIQKDTLVLTNIWAIHMDPRHWEEPEEFRPQRFLDEEGKLKHRESFVPFLLGSRQCIGEMIAKNMMFLITTNVLQDFTLSIAEEPGPGLGKQGINFAPNDYKIIATPLDRV